MRWWYYEMVRCLGRWLLQQWFEEQRGAAMGLYNAIGACQLSFPSLFVVLLKHWHWRETFRLAAVVCPAVLLLATVLMRDRPEQCGWQRDGRGACRADGA